MPNTDGVALKPNSAAFDTQCPIVYDDELMSTGSLMLVELGHSKGTYSGVPGDGALLPNVAWEAAATLLGAGTATSLSATVLNTLSANDLAERTPKGGLHVIKSQVTDSQNQRLAIQLPDAIMNYLLAHTTNDIFLSTVYTTTRVATDTQVPLSIISSTTAATGNFLDILKAVGVSETATLLGSRDSPSPRNTLAPSYAARAVTNWVGTPPASLAQSYRMPFMVGPAGPYGNTYTAKCPSVILYGLYIEDLTASGRTFADVDAIAYARFQRDFASGGRYNGDTTPTAPSSKP